MAATLNRLGFDVDTLLDPSRAALEAAVRRYGDRSIGADVSLFYYSGHALEWFSHNWLLPVTASLATERDLRFEAEGMRGKRANSDLSLAHPSGPAVGGPSDGIGRLAPMRGAPTHDAPVAFRLVKRPARIGS
jgi:Caspase domain